MKLFMALIGASSVLVPCGTASAQSYTPLPGVLQAADITPDGELLVGTWFGGGYYWHWRVDPAPTFIGGRSAVAVSDDGTVIAGNLTDPATGLAVAGRWTQATGWLALGGFNGSCSGEISFAHDMSADGSVIVGVGWKGCNGQGFVWTEADGLEELEWLGNQRNSARAVSADGKVAVGYAEGNFGRTPAYWTTSDQLGVVPDMDDKGEYYGITDDGSIRLGFRNDCAFFEESGVETILGGLSAGGTGIAVDASESGGTIVGYDLPPMGFPVAWVWNPVAGVQSLQDRLQSLGVPGVPTLGYVSAITPDGKTVPGVTLLQTAWVVEIPPGPIAKPYGCGSGNPPESLTHTRGSSSVGSTIQLGVDDPTGSTLAPALGFVSYALQPAPGFPCGVPLPGFAMRGAVAELLIGVAPPNPILTQVAPALWTTPGQPVKVDLPIPLDAILYGVELYAQGALVSPSTTKIGLTNGMRITIGLS